MRLAARRRGRGPAITLVPMVDVMMILLIFFMVTSTYLDLDMVPAVHQADRASAAPAAGGPVLMVRISADGAAVVAGRRLDADGFAALLRDRLAADPLTQVLLLPSAEAALQGLISAMDVAARAGATRLRVVRLEAQP
jgi:biopolymer transport protein ExbD